MGFFSIDKFEEDTKKLMVLIRDICAEDHFDEVKGRKKLVKLAFFANYLDFDQNVLDTQNKIFSQDYFIYNYGPFSFDLMNNFDELKDKKLVEEKRSNLGYRIEVTDKGNDKAEEFKQNLNPTAIERIEKAVERFGAENANRLEQKSLDYLGIDEDEKPDFIGTPVEVIISEA